MMHLFFFKQFIQLLQDISARQDELLPKKKFAFKSRKKDNPAPSVQKAETKSEEEKSVATVTSGVDEKMVGFKDQKNQKLRLNVSTNVCEFSLSLSLSLSLFLSFSLPPPSPSKYVTIKKHVS